MKRFIYFMILWLLPAWLQAQTNIANIEYWFDGQYSTAVKQSTASATDVTVNDLLDVSSLVTGLHTVTFRFQDDRGIWGAPLIRFFKKESEIGLQKIVALEYWYDDDYANKTATSFSATSLLNLSEMFDVASLNNGLHFLSLRLKDERGRWNAPACWYFTKSDDETPVLHQLTAMEYWYDGDYSTVQNDPVSATSALNLDTDLDVSGLNEGVHIVSCRFRDEAGIWSSAFSTLFSKYPASIAADMHDLVSVEYWIDGDISNSVKSSIPAGPNYILNKQLDVSLLNDGVHYLTYRFQDEAGVWGPGYSELFSKYQDEIVTTDNTIERYRYWVNDQFSSAVEVVLSTPVKLLTLDDLVDVSSLPGGTNNITFQFKDSVGMWSSAYTESYIQDFNPRGTITAQTDPACTQSTVTFTAETFDTDSIYWDFGDTTEIVGRTAAEEAYHAYTSAGTYTVTATLLNVDSAYTSTATTSITVDQSYGVSVVAPENLIAYYPLDGNAEDESGFTHDGTVFEAIPTTDRNGNANQAYYFDGVNDYIDLGDWENGGSMSFTFWARWDAFNNYSRIVDLGNGSSSNNIIVANYQTGNNIFFSIYNNSSEIKYYTPAITLGQWDYFAATIDEQGEMKVYKNGAFIGNKTNAYVPKILTRTAQYIGKSNFSADGYFKGAIDELKIYNKALSAEEIQLDYQGTGGTALPPVEVEICASEAPYAFGTQQLSASGTYYENFPSVTGCDSVVQLNLTIHPVYSSLDMPDPADLFAYYPFSGNASDESGNGHDGTVNGATLTEDRNGNASSAYLFDGNDAIDVSHSDELNMSGELSISCWIKPTVLQNAMIFGKSNYVSATNYLLRVQSDGNIQWEYDGYLNSTTKPLQADNWYHIVVTANNPGERRKVYVNGQMIAETNSSSGPFGSVTNKLTFGYASRNAEYFKGVIDDIRFYNKELTDNEITALYHEFSLVEEKEICSSETPYKFGTQNLYASGTYTETFHTEYGCDSTVTLDLVVKDSFVETMVDSVCDSELPYIFGSQTLTGAGEYMETYTAVNGCDSTVTLTLDVNPSYNEDITVSVCDSELPYIFGTQSLTTAGEYTETFTSVSGCDSVVTLDLAVVNAYNESEAVSVCSGELPYSFGKQSLTASGEYSETFTSVGGCDSTVALTFTVNPEYDETATDSVCSGWLPYLFGKQSLTSSGDYTETFASVNSCDSVVHLSLTVLPIYTTTDTVTVCSSELPYSFGSQSLTIAGEYTETFAADNGCDSTVTLTFNVNPAYQEAKAVSVCSGELPYSFGEQSLTASGEYSETFTSVRGCDSTVALTFTVNPEYDETATDSVCSGELPYLFGKQSLTSSGDYTETFASVNSCDSVVHLSLTVLPIYTITDTVTVCSSELPYSFGSQSLTIAGEYTETFAADNGCDSTVTLTFNVNPAYSEMDTVSVCESELPYVFGKQSLTSAGNYTETFTTVNNCDSVVTLNFVVNSEYNEQVQVTVYQDELPYVFGSQSLSASGEYTELFTSSEGCDSTVTLTLTVQEKDIIPPVVVCHPVEVLLNAYGSYSLTTSDISNLSAGTTDNRTAPEQIDIIVKPGSFSCDQAGAQVPVMVIAMDEELNSDTCYTTVHVVDNVPPAIICKSITVELDENGQATIRPEELYSSLYDACQIASISIQQSTFDCSNLGRNTIRVIAVDNNGNQSYCNATVTVVDKLPPAFVPVDNIEVSASAGQCNASISYPDITADDNCSLSEIRLLEGIGSDGEFPVGTTLERWVAVDIAGNTDTLVFEVRVSANPVSPTIDSIQTIEVNEDETPVNIDLSGISDGSGCETGSLNFILNSFDALLIDSYQVDYIDGGNNGTLTLNLKQDVFGETQISLLIQNLTTQKEKSVDFNLVVHPVNDPPFLIGAMEDIQMTTHDTLRIDMSFLKGRIFDDVDEGDEHALSLTLADGSDLPGWLQFANDSLIANPTSADTGTVNLLLKIEDLEGGSVVTTFKLRVDFPVGTNDILNLQSDVRIYPNPSSGQVFLEFKGERPDESEISVINMLGVEIFKMKYRLPERIQMDFSDQPSGIYFILINRNGVMTNHKLMLKN